LDKAAKTRDHDPQNFQEISDNFEKMKRGEKTWPTVSDEKRKK